MLNVARYLGLISGLLVRGNRAWRVLGNFLKVPAPAAGRFYREAVVGNHVEKGLRLARLRDLFGASARTSAPRYPDVLS